MKCYVLIVSEYFPKHHPRAGQKTGFIEKIKAGEKIHTIRENFMFWADIIFQVAMGDAYISVRVWTGKPYRSPQKEIMRFYEGDVNRSPLWISKEGIFLQEGMYFTKLDEEELANNDGLSLEDFREWFEKPDEPKKYALIYISKKRPYQELKKKEYLEIKRSNPQYEGNFNFQ